MGVDRTKSEVFGGHEKVNSKGTLPTYPNFNKTFEINIAAKSSWELAYAKKEGMWPSIAENAILQRI
jgi:hypothetical protein